MMRSFLVVIIVIIIVSANEVTSVDWLSRVVRPIRQAITGRSEAAVREQVREAEEHLLHVAEAGQKAGWVDPNLTVLDLKLKLAAAQLAHVQENVDWDKLRDDYWLAVFHEDEATGQQEEEGRRQLSKSRRRRGGGGSAPPKKNRRQFRPRQPPRRVDGNGVDVTQLAADLDRSIQNALGQAFGGSTKEKEEEEDKEVEDMTDPTEVKEEAEEDAKQEEEAGMTFSITDFMEKANPPGDSEKVDEKGDSGIQMDSSEGGLTFSVNDMMEQQAVQPEARVDPPGGGDDGIPIPIYVYNQGNCPDDGDSFREVPCAPDNLQRICDKYDEDDLGKFSDCFEACTPAFCCIHDADPVTNFIAPNCNDDVNCAQYAYCYIVWWKLHDTIGPATELRLEGSDDFYDVDSSFIEGDVTNVLFFREMLFHHFDDAQAIIEAGTVEINETLSEFQSDRIFLNETYWDTDLRRKLRAARKQKH